MRWRRSPPGRIRGMRQTFVGGALKPIGGLFAADLNNDVKQDTGHVLSVLGTG